MTFEILDQRSSLTFEPRNERNPASKGERSRVLTEGRGRAAVSGI